MNLIINVLEDIGYLFISPPFSIFLSIIFVLFAIKIIKIFC